MKHVQVGIWLYMTLGADFQQGCHEERSARGEGLQLCSSTVVRNFEAFLVLLRAVYTPDRTHPDTPQNDAGPAIPLNARRTSHRLRGPDARDELTCEHGLCVTPATRLRRTRLRDCPIALWEMWVE